MTPALNLSDVVLIRSASYDKNIACGVAQTPPPASACPACARADRTRVSDRDLQALRPTQLSLRRRAWPRAQAIFVDDRPNRSFVLGMKGTFAQAELHIIRARLHGGKLN